MFLVEAFFFFAHEFELRTKTLSFDTLHPLAESLMDFVEFIDDSQAKEVMRD